MHGGFAYTKSRGQLAATPVRRSILGLLSVAESILARRVGVSTAAGCPEWNVSSPSIPTARDLPLPPTDGRRRGPQPILDATERCTLRKHQDEASTKNIPRRQRTGLHNAAKLLLIFTEHDLIAIHASLDVKCTSNVYSATATSQPPFSVFIARPRSCLISLSTLQSVKLGCTQPRHRER